MIKIIGVVMLLVILGIGILALRMNFKKTDLEILKYFQDKELQAEVDRIQWNGGQLRYLKTGNPNANTVLLFVHGAPGGLDMFNTSLAHPLLQDSFLMLSIDRPGYGDSFTSAESTSLEIQVDAITRLMDRFKSRKFIVFGHSFGGPITGLIAHRRPDLVEKIILAGAAVDPTQERFVGLATIANLKILSGLASADTKMASAEKVSHISELKKIEHIWKELNCPVMVMHGTKDWLVPYENYNFLKKRIPKQYFIDKTLEGENHFFIGNAELLSSVILNP